ncbi:MAG: hypothetical protein IIA66_06570 [Planctomycetes bacterium]|nr:hypothetical protein [Planctomycetota bacterium]
MKSGELVVLGVVQEQHPNRAKLYKQWRQIDWPILVDSLNLLDLAVVPVPVTIDESGIVRHAGRMPSSLATEFVRKTYDTVKIGKNFNRAERADPQKLRQQVSESGGPTRLAGAAAYRDLGDAYFFQPTSESLDRCIEAYQQAIKLDPRDGRAHFRLGAALRKRSESTHRRPGDAQAAVAQWGEALATNPNQYIWRRRIQQYGPRLDKPYNFYAWVEQARNEIKARGDKPVQLAVEPTGSELIAAPRGGRRGRSGPESSSADHASLVQMRNSDPQGKIVRDSKNMVTIETVVTPARVQPGQRVRVRATFRLNEKSRPYWNNEAGDGVTIWVDVPGVFTLGEGESKYSNPGKAETRETRVLEFELTVSAKLPAGEVELSAYALYYICENKGGKCLYLRQDFNVKFVVDPQAPKIQ